MEKSARRAIRAPRGVVTDKLKAYIEGVDMTFGGLTRHVRTGPFVEGEISTRPIERLHGTIKDRTKILRALANIETSRLFISGWALHYNFFRPHSGLNGLTPAQAAGAKTPIRNWADVVKMTG